MWSMKIPITVFCSTPRADSLPKMQQNSIFIKPSGGDCILIFSGVFKEMSCMNSSSKLGSQDTKERVENFNCINHLFTSSGSVLEVGISELSPFCRNFKSYMSIQHTHHVCHLLSLHPPKKNCGSPNAQCPRMSLYSCFTPSKNHSQKHSDGGCRKVSVKIEKFMEIHSWSLSPAEHSKTFPLCS